MSVNNQKLAEWVAHLEEAQPVLSPALQVRVLSYRAEMGADVGNRLLEDLGLKCIPKRVRKTGPVVIAKFCKRLARGLGELSPHMFLFLPHFIWCKYASYV